MCTYESQPTVQWSKRRRAGSRVEAGEKVDVVGAAVCLHLPKTADERTSVFSHVCFCKCCFSSLTKFDPSILMILLIKVKRCTRRKGRCRFTEQESPHSGWQELSYSMCCSWPPEGNAPSFFCFQPFMDFEVLKSPCAYRPAAREPAGL